MADIKACRALLAAVLRGEVVATSELRAALGIKWWSYYVQQSAWAKELRTRATIARSKLGRYLVALRIADRRYAKPSLTPTYRSRRRRRAKTAEQLYEQALEILSEMVEENGGLASFLDRPFTPYSWDSTSEIGPDRETVPRLFLRSSSHSDQSHPYTIKSDKELKLDALRRAIEGSRAD